MVSIYTLTRKLLKVIKSLIFMKVNDLLYNFRESIKTVIEYIFIFIDFFKVLIE